MPVEATGPARSPVLEVEGLSLATRDGLSLVDDVSLGIGPGEILALVGESGSGKSLTALSLLGLLPEEIVPVRGSVAICGEQVVGAAPRALNRMRGNTVGTVFQQPVSMLDPTCRVATQVGEPLRIHRRAGRRSAWAKAVELLREVGIPDPEQRARGYAHQLSGGMAQRVMIASALSGDPALLVADEPTTALDVTVQAQILDLLVRARDERRLSILLITHDLSIVRAMADRVAVMYAGRIVEEGAARAVMRCPKHPYTAALLRCSRMERDEGGLYAIPGIVPRPGERPQGCRFLARCAVAAARGVERLCAEREPGLRPCGGGRRASCWAVEDATAADRSGPPRGVR